nr:hypothetical protein [uncultured bacterium]
MSVYGTGTIIITLEVFLGSMLRYTIHAAVALWYYYVQQSQRICLLSLYLLALTYYSVSTRYFHCSVTPSKIMVVSEY